MCCTSSHTHQQSIRVPSSLSTIGIVNYHFFILAILVGVQWYLIMVYQICIFLITKAIEHVFMCLLGIHISSLLKCLTFCPLGMGEVSYYWVVRLNNILNTSTLSDMWFANIFSQSVASLFNFSNGVFWKAKIFNLNEVQIIIFSCMNHAFAVLSKKSLWNPNSQ